MSMRPTAIVPALLSAGALVLAFLCLFAGNKPNFMEDYHVLTLNVSRIGEGIVNDTLSSSGSPLSSLWNKIPPSIQGDVGAIAGEVTRELGIEEFYSVHLLDYCYGDYTPSSVPNATLPLSAIHKNVTGCSPARAMFWFNPEEILSQALAKTGLGITLSDLQWPADVDRGLAALRIVSKTAFVLYCVAIALIFLTLLAALPAVFSAGRLAACLNVMLASLAFLAIGLASALITAVIVKGGDVINRYGTDVGVQAYKGGKFLALTWAATAAMAIVLLAWSVEVCCGHSRRRRHHAKGDY